MRRIVPPVVLLIVGALAGAQPAPTQSEIRVIVAKLGSEEFADREAAAKRLDEIGASALAELRAGCKSENPEIARRSQDILRKIERRLSNEKTLAPTLVELDAKDEPLDAVLAELSKQAKCEVVVGGLKREELAVKRITVSTGGKVPFWDAVLKVCEASEAQIASVAGFMAPDAMPYFARGPRGVRIAKIPEKATVLEARDGAKRRPAAVCGAVLVEALPLPKTFNAVEPSVLLQVWPEPRLQWQSINSSKVTTAIAAAGAKLVAEPGVLAAPRPARDGRDGIVRDGVVMIRNADGSVTFVRDTSGKQGASGFNPNPWQTIVRFKQGEKPSDVVKELNVTLFGTMRSGVEPLSQASGLELNKLATGTGVPAVEMHARYQKDENGKWVATVTLNYDATVHPATLSDELAGVKAGANPGNQTVYGIRVTDADGRPFILGLGGLIGGSGAQGKQVSAQATLELYPDKDGQGPPATITFWGGYLKTVEVPLLLKDVPLSGGKK